MMVKENTTGNVEKKKKLNTDYHRLVEIPQNVLLSVTSSLPFPLPLPLPLTFPLCQLLSLSNLPQTLSSHFMPSICSLPLVSSLSLTSPSSLPCPLLSLSLPRFSCEPHPPLLSHLSRHPPLPFPLPLPLSNSNPLRSYSLPFPHLIFSSRSSFSLFFFLFLFSISAHPRVFFVFFGAPLFFPSFHFRLLSSYSTSAL